MDNVDGAQRCALAYRLLPLALGFTDRDTRMPDGRNYLDDGDNLDILRLDITDETMDLVVP